MLCTASDALIGYVTAPSTRLSFDPVRSAVRIELALALRQFHKQRSLLSLNRVRRARLHWLAFSPNGEDRLAHRVDRGCQSRRDHRPALAVG